VSEKKGSANNELRSRWEIYLASGNARPLLAFLREHPEVRVPCTHPYPFDHCVGDVVLERQAYRVRRCVQCDERLTFTPFDQRFTKPDEPGITYWLQGRALREWADRLADLPSHPADWRPVEQALTGRGLD
jgi:hypothetical protein